MTETFRNLKTEKYYLSEKMMNWLKRHGEKRNTDINILGDNDKSRRLTPTECARLQTIPEWYKWQCSNTQQYKMLGNGWTVEVIKHIFGYMIE